MRFRRRSTSSPPSSSPHAASHRLAWSSVKPSSCNHASQGSDSAQDLTDAGTFDTVRFENAAASAATLDVDDYYLKSGATSATDRFGPVEVFGYQAWPSSGTDNGSALDLGTWDPAIGNIFTGNAAHLPRG